MKIPFPAFIKRIFETPKEDKRKLLDVRNTQSSQASCSSTRQLMTPFPLEQRSTIINHMSTPIPQTPVFLRNNHWQGSYSRDLTSLRLSQELRGRFQSALTTPMVITSLGSLESSTTPADAFPDILDIIDQSWQGNSYESPPVLISGSKIQSTTDSACVPETPQNELALIEMLFTVAEQIESEKTVSRSYAYTRPEDVLLSRKNGQRKCQHAKLMTEDEKKYYKKSSSRRAKERRKKECSPARGFRRSARIKKRV